MKNILIMGMGITGISAYNYLKDQDYNIFLYDFKGNYPKSEDYVIFNKNHLNVIDFVIKSPGIKPDNEIIKLFAETNVPIISDIEFFQKKNSNSNIVAVTGTNGKTTITKLLGEILSAHEKTYLGGNIGLGVTDLISIINPRDFAVFECSSFQLENTYSFKPKVSIITNITPDHLDWHGTFENYVNAKLKIFKNQDKNDFTILNFDDHILSKLNLKDKSVYWFSTVQDVVGAFAKNGKIYFKDIDCEAIEIMDINKIAIPGRHNLENILAALLAALLMGVDRDKIVERISNFTGVEHRIEFVKEIEGVKYYNDSKGTNPNSTEKALEALGNGIVLIAGGYDKNADFEKLLESGKDKIVSLVLIGQTKEKIMNKAMELGFTNIYLEENLFNAVKLSSKIAKRQNKVLLSPACASWDMYSSYEERGREFKKFVNELG